MKNTIDKFFASQLREWDFARKNYDVLKTVKKRTVTLHNLPFTLQFNPARILSTTAKIDKASLAARPCFLCDNNLHKEQSEIALSEHFKLLINPFPILRQHFTIVNAKHTPQKVTPYLLELLEISENLGNTYTVFYNGAKAGASAPDHMHFQAGLTEQFMIWEKLKGIPKEELFSTENLKLKAFDCYAKTLLMEGKDKRELLRKTEQIIGIFAKQQPQEEEPMLNLLAKFALGWKILFFPRKKYRPDQYFAEGAEHFLLSPASVEFGGLFPVVREEDFMRIDAPLLEDIFKQLSLDLDSFAQLKEQIRNENY